MQLTNFKFNVVLDEKFIYQSFCFILKASQDISSLKNAAEETGKKLSAFASNFFSDLQDRILWASFLLELPQVMISFHGIGSNVANIHLHFLENIKTAI